MINLSGRRKNDVLWLTGIAFALLSTACGGTANEAVIVDLESATTNSATTSDEQPDLSDTQPPATTPPVVIPAPTTVPLAAAPQDTAAPTTVPPTTVAPTAVAPPTTVPAATVPPTTFAPSDFTWSGATDPAAIPLGDGKLSTSPQAGLLYSCQTVFGGRGAPHAGPWIDDEAATWDSTAKLSVLGANSWPEAAFATASVGSERVIAFTNLPTEHPTGNFPIDPNDPAYEYDRNPNGIDPKMIELAVPAEPTTAAQPSCVDMGPIAVLTSGVFLYNALDAAGADAAAHEVQDSCDGHPDGAEAYHYHDAPSCLVASAPATGSTLIGYALDGFGIYLEYDALGNLPTNADLDECHGRTSTVLWGGVEQEVYHYSATLEYPYTIGCFRGDPVATPRRN